MHFRKQKLIPIEEETTQEMPCVSDTTIRVTIVKPQDEQDLHVKIAFVNMLIRRGLSFSIHLDGNRYTRVHSLSCECNGFIDFICVDKQNSVVKKRVPKSFMFRVALV